MSSQKQNLVALESRLAYQFKDRALLVEAMSHASLDGQCNNERLEFLGDSVLNLAMAEHLVEAFPQLQEGQLSRIRAQLVCKSALAEVGAGLRLGDAIILGPSEAKGGSAQRHSILADAVEALIGAVFIEGGYLVAKEAIFRWFSPLVERVSLNSARKDPKTRLQEYCQQYRYKLPLYTLISEQQRQGESYFEVTVEVAELKLSGYGEGLSRKKAEQMAASQLLDLICENSI